MRAVTFTNELAFNASYQVPALADGECIVRVHLAGICSTDLHITRGYMNFSGVLGHEMVGTVEQGPDEWLGRRVACEINCVCSQCDMCQAGLSNHCRKRTVLGIDRRDGCFADYVAVPHRNCHAIPDSISDEEAVFVEPLAAAWQVVKQVPLETRTRVAVIGSGKLGLLVAQVIKLRGCPLEMVGRNPNTLSACEKRGIRATHINEVVFRNDRDVVVECSGSPEGMAIALQMVRPRGTIVLKSTYAGTAQLDLAPAVIHEVSIIGSRCGPFAEAINSLDRKEIEVRPLISRTLPIQRAIEAFKAAQDPGNIKVLLKINPR